MNGLIAMCLSITVIYLVLPAVFTVPVPSSNTEYAELEKVLYVHRACFLMHTLTQPLLTSQQERCFKFAVLCNILATHIGQNIFKEYLICKMYFSQVQACNIQPPSHDLQL